MEDFFNNPGLLHIGEEILKNLDFKTKVSIRLVKKSWKRALDKTAPKVGLDDLLKILQTDLVIPHEEFFSSLLTLHVGKHSQKLVRSFGENPF